MTSANYCVFIDRKVTSKKTIYIYSNLYYNITPYNFCKPTVFLQFLFCYKIKYVNLGLFIWLFYFDIVDTLLQFIERNSDHSVSKSMLFNYLIYLDLFIGQSQERRSLNSLNLLHTN